jgi:5-methylcytosine-specific restriction endonuclease McrA
LFVFFIKKNGAAEWDHWGGEEDCHHAKWSWGSIQGCCR